jgi:Protein of unknown function (DUF2934)
MPKSTKRTTDNGRDAAARSNSAQSDPIRVSDDRIARRAYELYLFRGGEEGHDMDDWLLAERELRDGLPQNA